MLCGPVPLLCDGRRDLSVVCVRGHVEGFWVHQVRTEGHEAAFEEGCGSKAALSFTEPGKQTPVSNFHGGHFTAFWPPTQGAEALLSHGTDQRLQGMWSAGGIRVDHDDDRIRRGFADARQGPLHRRRLSFALSHGQEHVIGERIRVGRQPGFSHLDRAVV